MQSSLPSSRRAGAIVSLVGVGLMALGLMLPLFIQSNPQVPNSAHGVYEWQIVSIGSSLLNVVLSIAALLPVVAAVLVLITSVMALRGNPVLQLTWLIRTAAVVGLAIQVLFEIFVYVISQIGYARTDIALGFWGVPLGLLIMVIGVFIAK